MLKIYTLILLLHFTLYGTAISKKVKNSIDQYQDDKTKSILYKYYKKNSFQPFWLENNQPKDIAFLLIDSIDDNTLLKPYKNELFNFRNLFFFLQNDDIINFELQLTLYYDKYSYYLNKGIINTQELDKKLLEIKEEKNIDVNWQRYPLRKNRQKLLYKIVKNNDISLLNKSYKLTYPNINTLFKYIQNYEKVLKDGDFIKISKPLKPNDNKKEVKKLRLRLMQEDKKVNLLTYKELKSLTFFDEKLKQEVINFQKRHGLKADGIVGKNTRRYLNISANEKIALIRLNIERIKWLPKNLGKNFFIVNIPEYNLKLYKENELSLNMPIVVGKKEFPTAVFSNKISAVVLNPYWRIPQSIVKNEVIPKLKNEPDYLEKHGIKIHENWEEQSASIESSLVDWSYYTTNDEIDLPLKFIQEPNKTNPLGKIKFLFPNRYAIYLHDTPAKEFFSYNKRAYSHGCIRLSKPQLLLETIAKLNSELDFEESLKILEDNKKSKIELNKTIPIHIVYLTTWIDENNQIQFRDDIYGFDKLHEELIKQKKWLY